MANDIAVSTIAAQKALESLKPITAPLTAFSTDFSDEARAIGETVSVNVFGAPTATNATLGGAVDYATEASGVISHVNVPLTSHVRTSHAFNLRDLALLSNEGMAEAQVDLITSVIEKVQTIAITALNTSAATLNVTEANAIAYADLTALRLKVAALKLAMTKTSLIVSPEAMSLMLKLDEIGKSFSAPIANAAVADGNVARVLGFNVFETQAIPETSFAIAAHKTALALAARSTQESGAEFEQVLTLPGGVPVTVKLIADPIHAQKVLVAETVFGATAVKASSTEKRAVALLKAKA